MPLMETILQEFKDDILTKVNAKVCAPALRRQGVIPQEIELKILSEAVAVARGTLYDHLKSDCTLRQLEKLAEVLVSVDRGYGTTNEVGQELQKRIQGSDAHKRRSPSPEANSPSSSSSASTQTAQGILIDHLQKECTLQQTETVAEVPVDADSGFGTAKEAGQQLQKRMQGSASWCSRLKKQTLIIFCFAVFVVLCAIVVIGMSSCLSPWPFTYIWRCQVCCCCTSVEKNGLSTATPDVQVEEPDMTITTEELHYLRTVVKIQEAKVDNATLQAIFQITMATLYELFRIKFAGGVDTEFSLRKKKRNFQNSEFSRQGAGKEVFQQLLNEQEETCLPKEVDIRATEVQSEAEEQARVAREAEGKARKELDEHQKKPTNAEMVVETGNTCNLTVFLSKVTVMHMVGMVSCGGRPTDHDTYY